MSAIKQAKALTLKEPQNPPKLEICDTSIPSPAPPGSATVQVIAAGIEGSARPFVTGAASWTCHQLPFVPGVQAVGRVLETGPDATLLQPGDLVLVDPFIRSRDEPATTQILQGLHGGPTDGQKKLMRSGWPDGTWKTVVNTPLENTHRLDESLIATDGPFGYTVPELTNSLSRFAVVYGGLASLDLKAGQTVIVAPATGHFSGAAAEVAAAMGARVIALGRSADKLARVCDAVNKTYPSGPRMTYVAMTDDAKADEASLRALLPSGSPGADSYLDISPGMAQQPSHLSVAVSCLRPGGKMTLMGAVFQMSLPYFMIMFKQITLRGKWMYTQEEIGEMLRMVEAGVIKVGKQAGHETIGEYDFEDWETALSEEVSNAADPWGKGAVFVPRHEG